MCWYQGERKSWQDVLVTAAEEVRIWVHWLVKPASVDWLHHSSNFSKLKRLVVRRNA